MTTTPRKATLNLDLNEAYVPVVLDFAEGCTKAFNLTDGDAARVRLACEEVFSHLCSVAKTGSKVAIEARNEIYQMEIAFLFKADSFDPYAFNLTADVKPEEEQMDGIGLLIASRSVDRFSIRHSRFDGLSLVLTKGKTYPPYQDGSHKIPPLKGFIVRRPDSEMAKGFARTGVGHYDDLSFPPLFRTPARMVDMLSHGDYGALVATGTGTQGAEVGGGIVWRPVGKAMIEFYGPYVFDQSQREGMAQALVDGLLASIAKTDATGIFGRCTTPDLPGQYFEPLGAIEYGAGKDAARLTTFHYRQLKEDEGAHVWADPLLKPFLQEAYQRLFLPREIMETAFEGETVNPHSVVSVEFDRQRDSATLRPVWDGVDRARNIGGHVRMLKEEGLNSIFFELDLGSPWQAKMAPALYENGFTPVLLLPYAGQVDLVIFQHSDRDRRW